MMIKNAMPAVGFYYYYGEARFFAGLNSRARKCVSP